MNFRNFIDEITSSSAYSGQIEFIHEVPAKVAEFADFSVADPAGKWLRETGIDRIYTHQAQAITATGNGDDVLIATGTASGKSLCYTVPLLNMPELSTSLLLYPSKALCQDQFQRFQTAMTASECQGLAGVYDGDTPGNMRKKIRDYGRFLFTNPDMLHAGIMPQHPRWAQFLSRLKYVIVDELHVYSGIFGSNMGNLIRRFDRLCRHYGCKPQYICCSATIANPFDMAHELTGRDFTVIDRDGSPHGRKTFVFWNPPIIRNTVVRSRRSANVEAHELMSRLVESGVRTITFSKTKMTAEMIHRYVTDYLRVNRPGLMKKITPYRGGYLPTERREIERKLFSGELTGVSTTRALELGIDVGGLDASLMVGYPGTLASFYQQAGRAGRSDDESLVILVGLDTPANQYIMRHPEYIFGRPLENAVLDVDNPFVITGHIRCAAQELAIDDVDLAIFGKYSRMVAQMLEENMKLSRLGDRWYHAASETPQHEISLRSYSDANVMIMDVDTGAVLGEVDKYDAEPLLHPEAIYMHLGDTYRVLTLDMERNIARVVRTESDYYTQPLGGTDVNHIDYQLREKVFGVGGKAYWGEVTAHFQNYAFEKVRFYELDAISRHGLDLPYLLLETQAVWIVPPEDLMRMVRTAGMDPMNGLRGIGYATRMLLPLFFTCDTLDFSHSIGATNAPWNAIFIYERYPRGLGFTEKVYERLGEIMPAVLQRILECPCADGCPCCVGKPLRGELNWNPERGEGSIPSKSTAIAILQGILAGGKLNEHESETITTTTESEEIRMERMLRRRQEWMRTPQDDHQIEQNIETKYPESEKQETLTTPDQQIRGSRRAKSLRVRLAEKIKKSEERGEKSEERGEKSENFESKADVEVKENTSVVIKHGDSLASRIKGRRLKNNE
jgi:DEAD/DEAH box helicase domain-containing protein